MNIVKYCLLALLVLPSLAATAQETPAEEPFNADRPGVVNGTNILPKGRLQWETGAMYEHRKEGESTINTWTVNTTVLRYGLNGFAELQLCADWATVKEDDQRYSGLANVAVGTKIRMCDQWRFLPASVLVAYLYVPDNKGDKLLPKNWGASLGIAFEHEVTPWFSVAYEGSMLWSDYEKPIPFWGIALGFHPTDRWTIMVDQYNYKYPDECENWVELSTIWQFAKRMSVDIFTDIYLRRPGNYFNVGVGFCWQLTKR